MNAHGREWLISVEGERFRVRLRPRHGHLFEYDYTWLTGPNDGYGFGESGPSNEVGLSTGPGSVGSSGRSTRPPDT